MVFGLLGWIRAPRHPSERNTVLKQHPSSMFSSQRTEYHSQTWPRSMEDAPFRTSLAQTTERTNNVATEGPPRPEQAEVLAPRGRGRALHRAVCHRAARELCGTGDCVPHCLRGTAEEVAESRDASEDSPGRSIEHPTDLVDDERLKRVVLLVDVGLVNHLLDVVAEPDHVGVGLRVKHHQRGVAEIVARRVPWWRSASSR